MDRRSCVLFCSTVVALTAAPGIMAEPCTVCSDGGIMSMPEKRISLPGFEFIETCETLDDFIPGVLIAGSTECNELQSLGSICGCPVADNPCTLCSDGSPITTPDRVIDFLDLTSVGAISLAVTCDIYEASIMGKFTSGTQQCDEAQLVGSYCGCPKLDNYCEFCPGETVSEEYKSVELNSLGEIEGITTTCEFVETILHQTPDDDPLQCLGLQSRAFLCGCNNGVWDVGTIDTPAKKEFTFFAPMVSALSSIVVSYTSSYSV